MILFFNKQYREENGMINDLEKKIKKSTVLECKILGNTEIYTLDNIIVSFDILSKKLAVVVRNTGERVLDMNCGFVGVGYGVDELQNARFDMFSNLLEVARKTYEAHIEKAKKMSMVAKKMQEKKQLLEKVSAEKAVAEEAIVAARKRLKGL